MFSYTEAKQFLIDSLTQDAIAHDAGRYRDVGQSLDEFDANLPRDERPEFNKLFVALNFWDGWIDARNHDWQYYSGISQPDWPVLARHIVQAMVDDREITEPLVLQHFNLREGQSLRDRFNSLLGRFRGE
jgi:hypothetical protein